MMKPFPGDHERLSLEGAYNKAHCQTRRVVENAFGRLKGRFAVLVMSRIRNPKFMTKVTRVACALHNICHRMNDPCMDSWVHVEPYEQHLAYELRLRAEELDDAYCYFSADDMPVEAPFGVQVREVIARHMLDMALL
jgi:hypothetical protein